MKLRLLVLVIILGIAAIVLGWVYESRLRTDDEKADLVIPNNIDYFLTNLHYRAMNTECTLDYEFNSPRLEHYPGNDVSNIELPSVQIYRESDHWLVDALDGELLHRENLLRLRNQVVIQKRGDNPFQMYTESIRFEPDLDLVTSEAKVLMRSKQAQIEAEQAIFDLAGKIYRFNKTHTVYSRGDS
jgi:LPS export ABC transporter protein LptC